MISSGFLTNHAQVLVCIANDTGIRLRDIGDRIGITERAAQRIVAELAAAGYISRQREGRRYHYAINSHVALPGRIARGQSIGALLDILTGPPAVKPRVDRELNEAYPATLSSVPAAQASLSAFAAKLGISGERLEAVRSAAFEALTNVVVHAYRDAPGRIYLTAALTSQELWVLIADDGCGLRVGSDSPGRGRGLALIAHLSDRFAIATRSGGGTELQMGFSLSPVEVAAEDQSRGSASSHSSAARSRFSTTT